MTKIEHFEIPADDVARAKEFYASVFGFTFQDWDADTTMVMPDASGGIGGDIHRRGVVPHPTIVITVENLEETLASVVASGGAQLGEIERMGDNSRYAYFTDPDGNVVGVYDRTD